MVLGRSQRVVLDAKASDSCRVSSGVPQGSVLVPTLFLLYINDIRDNISSDIRLFADDTLLYGTIKSFCDVEIHEDLNKLYAWTQE